MRGCSKFVVYGVVGLIALVVLGSVIGGLSGGSRATATVTGQVVGTADGAGVATAKPQPTTVPMLKIGDTLEAKNWKIKAEGVERVDGDLVWSQFGNKTTAIGQWLIITLEVTNTGNENHTLNTHDFELKTAGGATLKHTTEGAWLGYADFKKMTSLSKQIPPGAVVKTPLLFDIPKGTQGINLVFTQQRDRPINVG